MIPMTVRVTLLTICAILLVMVWMVPSTSAACAIGCDDESGCYILEGGETHCWCDKSQPFGDWATCEGDL